MSLFKELLEAIMNSLEESERKKVEDELKSASVDEIAEDISEIVVDTVGDENNAGAEDDDTIDDAEAEGETPEAEAEAEDDDAIDDAEAEAETPEAEAEAEDDDAIDDAEAEAETPEAEAEAEDDDAIDAGDDSDVDSGDGADDVQAGVEAEGEAPEAEAEAEAETEEVSTVDKRIADIDAKLDMIIQMLTTSGPDGTHVPFVNIPGRSHYHDDMDLGEATRVLLTGKF